MPTKILIAEDEKQNIILFNRVMKKLGYNATIVENGSFVVDKLRSEDFDAVIMDISMPKMDGIEASKVIRAGTEIRNPNIPILLISGNSSEYLSEVCTKNNINSYICKPFRYNELKEKLEQIITLQD